MREIDEIIDKYGDMLYRICLVRLQNDADAEDAVQETFLKYIRHQPNLATEEHEKAWLIRVAINQSRDIYRRNRFRAAEDIDQIGDILAVDENMNDGDGLVLRCLMLLPDKFRQVMLLHFVEEMEYRDIAKIIGRSESAVKMRVSKGRELFTQIYNKELGKQ